MNFKNRFLSLTILASFAIPSHAEWMENIQKTRQALEIGKAMFGSNSQQQQQVPMYQGNELPQPVKVVQISQQARTYQQNTPVSQSGNEVSRTPGACPQHYPAGYPSFAGVEAQKQQRRAFYTCQLNYAAMLDPQTKTPLWVSERLIGSQQAGTHVERVDGFTPHPGIPRPAQAALNDYRNSKLDRGHMAPAADMLDSNAMVESFYLTNMVPQVGPNMNRGIWADLENMARKWSESRSDVQVVTGPIFEGNVAKIGSSQVWVPTSLFKVVLDLRTMESIAFIIPNQQIVTRKTKKLDAGNPQVPQTLPNYAINCGEKCILDNFIVSLKTVEQKTGLYLFPQVVNTNRDITYKQSRMWHAR